MMKTHFAEFFKLTPLAFLTSYLATFLIIPSHANTQTPDIDLSKPIPTLSSMNRLGKLQFNLPATDYFQIDGVPVAFTRLDGLPIIDISVVFDVGSAYDSTINKDAYGIANMTATMLTQGTTGANEEAFVKNTELFAINLGATASHDSFSINLRSLSKPDTLQNAILLTQDILQNPSFNNDILARNKARFISAIAQNTQDPSYVANLAYNQAMYGTHPYAMPVIGTPDSIDKIQQSDLIRFKDTYLVRENAHIIITGNLSKQNAQQVAKTLIKSLKNGNKAPKLTAPQKPKPIHIHIDHASPQTAIIIGNMTQKRRTDKDGVQLLSDFGLGNDILAGGEFTAHLMNHIRVKKGYTYGIYGQNTASTLGGDYAVRFATKADTATQAIFDTIAVIKNTLNTGINQDELSLTKTNEKRSYPNHFATNTDIHQTVKFLTVFGYDKAHLANRYARIDNATVQSVNQSLNQIIKPDEFVIVTVGNQKVNLDKENLDNLNSLDNLDNTK